MYMITRLSREGSKLLFGWEVESYHRHHDCFLRVISDSDFDFYQRRIVFHKFLPSHGNLETACFVKSLEEVLFGICGMHCVEDCCWSKDFD